MKQRPKTPLAAPDAKTPALDAPVPPQRGGIGKEAAETGDSFSYVGRARVCVGGAGRSSFVQPVTTPPVSGD